MEGLSIRLEGVGKKFYHRWLFKGIDRTLPPASSLALVGSNGSGKSTLLRIIAGQMNPSEGKVWLLKNGEKLPLDKVYQYVSWSAPYLEAYLDLSLAEQYDLHFSWKKCLLKDADEVINRLRLEDHKDKKLRYYSSGMLQRAMVGMALFSDTPVLLLDEPTSFMDETNASLTLDLIRQYAEGRIFILASNMHREFGDFQDMIKLDKG